MTDVGLLQAIGGLKATTFRDTVLSPMYVITEAVFGTRSVIINFVCVVSHRNRFYGTCNQLLV